MLYGLRVSLLFGFILTFSSAVLGIVVGAIQGYYGGWIDLIGQRILEVWGGLPMLFMVMILSVCLAQIFTGLFLIMLLFSWTILVTLVRAEFFKGPSVGLCPCRAKFRCHQPSYYLSAYFTQCNQL